MLYNLSCVVLCYITCVMLCYITYVMLCYKTYVMLCYVMLHNICHVMLHNICHVMLYNICRVMGYSRKKFTPPRRKARFFYSPPSTWISKTASAPLPSGFPSSKSPPPIWISITLLDTVILLYNQCRRILLGT